MSNAVALRGKEIHTALTTKGLAAIKDSLPSHLNADRMVRLAWSTVRTSPDLLKCTTDSILQCVIKCGETGLEPNALGHAYFVAFKRNKQVNGQWESTYECQFIPGYRGLVDLARRSGGVSRVYAECVYQGDEFRVIRGDKPEIIHVPDLNADHSDDKVAHVYMVATLKDGTNHTDWMTRADVEKIQARSKAKDKGPWATDWREMAKKTILRRGCKMLPMSIEFATAIDAMDRADQGLSQVVDLGNADATPDGGFSVADLNDLPTDEGDDDQAPEQIKPLNSKAKVRTATAAAPKPSTNEVPTGDAWSDVYDGWPESKQDQYNSIRSNAISEGEAKEDAHEKAYRAVTA